MGENQTLTNPIRFMRKITLPLQHTNVTETNGNLRWKRASCLKRWKMGVAELQLVLVLHLNGWKGGRFFFPDQSQSEGKLNATPLYNRYSIESHSIGFTRSPLNQEPYSNIKDLLFRLNSTLNAMFIIPAGNVNFKLTVDRVLILWWQKS